MRKTTVVALSVVFGLVVLGVTVWMLVIGPRFATVAEVRQETADLEVANASLAARNAKLQRQAEELPALAQEVETLLAAVPRTADLPVILEEYPQAVLDADLPIEALLNLSTGLPQVVESGEEQGSDLGLRFATIQTSIDVDGDLPNALRFIDNVQGLGRAVLISNTTFSVTPTTTEGDESGQLNISGEMFSLDSPLPDLVAQATAALRSLDEGPRSVE